MIVSIPTAGPRAGLKSRADSGWKKYLRAVGLSGSGQARFHHYKLGMDQSWDSISSLEFDFRV